MPDLSRFKTLILGASTKPQRYSYLAAHRLLEADIPFVLLGRSSGEVAGQSILQDWPNDQDIHTISIYLDASNQNGYAELLHTTKPSRVIFNPGSENPALTESLKNAGIEVLEACTLVMLSTGLYLEESSLS